MIIGIFPELYLLRTRTALVEGKVVVDGTVGEVTAGDVVVSKQE